MARTADDLARALEALWAAPGAGTLAQGPAIDTVQLVLDAVERCHPATQRAMEATASRISSSGVRVRELVLGAMDEIREAQAPIQGAEAWRTHRAWIDAMSPKIGDDVANLLNIGAGRSADELARAAAERARLVADLDRRIGVVSALLLPAALGPAPLLSDLADADRSLAHRRGTLTLHNVATLPGLPAVAFPIQRDDAKPLGAQLVGPRGRDRDVVALAALSAPRSP
jgi:amidase